MIPDARAILISEISDPAVSDPNVIKSDVLDND
jgi:hypothetical protein